MTHSSDISPKDDWEQYLQAYEAELDAMVDQVRKPQ